MSYDEVQGWLSPDGKMHVCGFCQHDEAAVDICAAENIPVHVAIRGDLWEDAGWALLERGWLHIGIKGEVYSDDELADIPPTQKQLDTLFDLAQQYADMREMVMYYLREQER